MSQKMTPALIAQLILTLGPTALELIPRLARVWSKPELSEAEVLELIEPSRKNYESYRAEALARYEAIRALGQP